MIAEARGLKHVKVREYLRSVIEHAEPGAAAPSERELVQMFGVARMTVRQAMDTLVAEGLLERIPGRGTFVTFPRRRVGRVTSFTEEISRRGLIPESSTLVSRREQAGPGVARALDLTEGDAVIHWKRVRRASGLVMCVEDAYLNEVMLPGFLQNDLPTSLYEALTERGIRPTWAEDAISADAATHEEAELLGVPKGSAVLRVSRRSLVRNSVVMVSRAAYPADRYTMYVQLSSDY